MSSTILDLGAICSADSRFSLGLATASRRRPGQGRDKVMTAQARCKPVTFATAISVTSMGWHIVSELLATSQELEHVKR